MEHPGGRRFQTLRDSHRDDQYFPGYLFGKYSVLFSVPALGLLSGAGRQIFPVSTKLLLVCDLPVLVRGIRIHQTPLVRFEEEIQHSDTYSENIPFSSVCLPWDYYQELGAPEIKNLDDLLDVLEQMQITASGAAFPGTLSLCLLAAAARNGQSHNSSQT